MRKKLTLIENWVVGQFEYRSNLNKSTNFWVVDLFEFRSFRVSSKLTELDSLQTTFGAGIPYNLEDLV